MVNDFATKKILKSQYIFKNFILFIFNWSVYPLISSTKSGPLPELEYIPCQNITICSVMHTNTYKESQYLPILINTDVLWPRMWRAALTVAESFCLRLEHVAIPPLSKNCKKGWDCSSWLLNQEIYLLQKMPWSF